MTFDASVTRGNDPAIPTGTNGAGPLVLRRSTRRTPTVAKLTAAQRKALPLKDFAVPSKAPGPGSYPIPDKAHVGPAKSRAAANASPAVQKRVDAKANKVLKGKGK